MPLYTEDGNDVLRPLRDLIDIPDGQQFRMLNTFWEDLRFPAAGINPPGAVADPTRDTTDGRLVFSASADNIMAIQAQMPQIVGFDNIPMGGKKFSCMLLLLVARLGSDAQDTYTGTAKLNEFDIHYEVDGFGTGDEYRR